MLSLIVDRVEPILIVTRAPVLSLIVDRVEPILCDKRPVLSLIVD